ncbi:hypothetical protein ACXC9Q_40365 [Kribbella sp. CWNU-51]
MLQLLRVADVPGDQVLAVGQAPYVGEEDVFGGGQMLGRDRVEPVGLTPAPGLREQAGRG